MLIVAFWISLALALLTVASAVVKAALEVESDNADKAETMSFVRMTLTGIFGVTIGQSLVPLAFAWWLTALVSVVLMLTLLIWRPMVQGQATINMSNATVQPRFQLGRHGKSTNQLAFCTLRSAALPRPRSTALVT